MKKLGFLALMLGTLGVAVIGCEPAKKKTDAPKTPAATEPAATGDAKPAETPAAPAADTPK